MDLRLGCSSAASQQMTSFHFHGRYACRLAILAVHSGCCIGDVCQQSGSCCLAFPSVRSLRGGSPAVLISFVDVRALGLYRSATWPYLWVMYVWRRRRCAIGLVPECLIKQVSDLGGRGLVILGVFVVLVIWAGELRRVGRVFWECFV